MKHTHPQSKQRHAWAEHFQLLSLLFATVGLLCYPQESAAAVTQGLSLCYTVIIPALFPFFILSSLLIDLGFCASLGKFLGKSLPFLFHLNPNCVTPLLLGFLGGYPVGAKTTLSLYQSELCSKEEAQRLLAFVSNAGPGFILSVIGVGIFASQKIGLLLYLAHVLACVGVGLLFRGGQSSAPKAPPVPVKKAFLPSFLSAVTTAMDSCFRISAFILCFSVVICLLRLSGLLTLLAQCLPLPLDYATALLSGMIELSSGVFALAPLSSPTLQLQVIGFLLGWAGISIHCQVLALCQHSGLSMKYYFMGNFLQGIFSAFFLALPQLIPLWTAGFSGLWAILFCLVFLFLFFSHSLQKKTRKKEKNSV